MNVMAVDFPFSSAPARGLVHYSCAILPGRRQRSVTIGVEIASKRGWAQLARVGQAQGLHAGGTRGVLRGERADGALPREMNPRQGSVDRRLPRGSLRERHTERPRDITGSLGIPRHTEGGEHRMRLVEMHSGPRQIPLDLGKVGEGQVGPPRFE